MEKKFIVTKSQLQRIVRKANEDTKNKAKLEKITKSPNFFKIFDKTIGSHSQWANWLSIVNGYDPNDEDMEGYSPEDIKEDDGWAYELIKDFFVKESRWKNWDKKQIETALDIFTKKRIPNGKEMGILVK